MNCFKRCGIFAFFALFTLVSCDDDVDTISPPSQDAFITDTNLALLMQDISDSEIVDCVDIVYPISFSIYNSDFQVIDTVVIESDDALLQFIQSLYTDEEVTILASLNYPITVNFEDGTSYTATNNLELEGAVGFAQANCDLFGTCDMDLVRDYLVECGIMPTLNSFTPTATLFTFLDSNELSTLYEGDLLYTGSWDIAMMDEELHIIITFNGLDDFNGDWIVVSCSADGLQLQQGDNTLILVQNCDTNNPFDCFGDITYVYCDEPTGAGVVDLNLIYEECPTDDVEIAYYETEADAQAQTNQLQTNYTTTTNPQTIFVRVTLAGTETFEVYSVELTSESCENTCSQTELDAYLIECFWNIVSYNGNDSLINYNLDFESTGTLVVYDNSITVDATYSTSVSSAGVIITFGNVAAPNIQAINGDWLVVDCQEDRLELQMGDDTIVMEQDCN